MKNKAVRTRFAVGGRVLFRLDLRQRGNITRIYPFDDKPNIMVKWDDGRIKSHNATELVA